MARRELKNGKKKVGNKVIWPKAVLAAKPKRPVSIMAGRNLKIHSGTVKTVKKPVLRPLDKEKTLFQFKNFVLDPDEKEQWISVMDQELREIRSKIDEESSARQIVKA